VISPARFAVRNPVVANLLMVAVVVLGLLSFVKLPRELFSRIPFHWVFVITPYPGVAAEEMERLVTKPIEDELQDLKGVDWVSSQSSEGQSFVQVRFEDMDDEEFRARFEDLRAEMAKLRDLPDDALDPIVQAFSTEDFMPVIAVHLHGRLPERRLMELARELKDELRDVPGISKVELTGVRDRELWVEADPTALEGHGVSLEQVRLAIAAQGLDIPAGKLTFGRREILVRTVGEFGGAGDIRKVIVRGAPGGGAVRVGDLAAVREGFEEETTRSRVGLEPVVSLNISKQADGNTLDVVAAVKRVSADFTARQGGLVNLSFTQDTGEMIGMILDMLSRNAWAGFLVVLVVLFVVLGARNAILAAVGIPVSFLAAFIAMDQMGETFNGNSLFGLVLVLGIIVDDAIIIVENCYRHRQQGKSWRDAAIDGTEEVALPVFAATATTVAAFLPAMLLPGLMGKFMRIVPIAVSIALAASMVEAFVILPAHIAKWPGKGRPPSAERAWVVSLRGIYERTLRLAVRRRYLLCFGLAPALVLGAALAIPLVGVDTYAGEEFGSFQVRVEMPTGTSLEATSATLEELERVALALPPEELRAVHATAGLVMTDTDWIFRTDRAQLWLDLTPSYARRRTEAAVMDDLRGRLSGIGGPSRIEVARINQGPPLGKAVELKVKGRYFEELERAAGEIQTLLRGIAGVRDIGDDFEAGKQELRLVVDPELAALHGLSVAEVGLAVRAAVNGVEADTTYDGDEEIKVVVRLDRAALEQPEDLLRLPLATRSGSVVTLGQVAAYTIRPSIAQIRRYKLERAITVFADVDDQVTTSPAVGARIVDWWEEHRGRFPGVALDFSGEFQEFNEALTGLVQLLAFGLLLVFGILAIQFRSYLQPLVILPTVFTAFVGAVIGLLISGSPFSIITLFGLMALAGIAVNDAIVLVSFVNDRKRRGMDAREAVIEAGLTRLRPIILTSVTTIAGLLPMALGLGGMSLTWGPLANTIVWGIGFGTLITLHLVPAGYTILVEDWIGGLRRRRERRSAAAAP
jgi:multidrug efflux pump subunit AcrB